MPSATVIITNELYSRLLYDKELARRVRVIPESVAKWCDKTIFARVESDAIQERDHGSHVDVIVDGVRVRFKRDQDV